jgi:hypothetical protein
MVVVLACHLRPAQIREWQLLAIGLLEHLRRLISRGTFQEWGFPA